MAAICEAIHSILKIIPPELAADIGSSGVYLSGGGSLLHNVDKMIQVKTGIRVIRADNPMECVAVGTGKALENISKSGLNYQQASVKKPIKRGVEMSRKKAVIGLLTGCLIVMVAVIASGCTKDAEEEKLSGIL